VKTSSCHVLSGKVLYKFLHGSTPKGAEKPTPGRSAAAAKKQQKQRMHRKVFICVNAGF